MQLCNIYYIIYIYDIHIIYIIYYQNSYITKTLPEFHDPAPSKAILPPM